MAELELTEREMAIIEGNDPNDAVVVDDEQDSSQDANSEVVDQNDDLHNEPISQSGNNDEDGSQDDKDVGKPSGGKEAASESVSSFDKKPKPQSWLDDSVRQLGRSLDISDEEMAEFGSRAEFDRATRFIAKRVSLPGARQQTQAPAQTQAGQSQSGQQQQQGQQPQGGSQAEGDDPLAMFDPERWREAGYDERTVAMVESHRRTLQRLAEQEESQKHIINGLLANQKSRFEDEFDSELDSHEGELFGKFFENGKRGTLDPNSPHYQNRAKVWEAYHTLVNGIRSRAAELGRQAEMPPTKTLIEQAKRIALGDQLSKIEKTRFHDKVREQSRRRRPAATQRVATTQTRANAKNSARTVTTTTDQIEDLLDNPELQAMYERFQEDNS